MNENSQEKLHVHELISDAEKHQLVPVDLNNPQGPIVADFFDKKSEIWDEKIGIPNPANDKTVELVGITAGSSVLDIGCGTGIMEPALLAAQVEKIVAIDISQKMIEIAARKYASEPRVTCLCRDFLDFEPDGELFDFAVIYNCYPHITNKPAFIYKVAAALKPGGRFIVAHGGNKDMINDVHKNMPAAVWVPLKDAVQEAKPWEEKFSIDQTIDADDFYCIIGTRK